METRSLFSKVQVPRTIIGHTRLGWAGVGGLATNNESTRVYTCIIES